MIVSGMSTAELAEAGSEDALFLLKRDFGYS